MNKIFITFIIVLLSLKTFAQKSSSATIEKTPANIRWGYWGGIGYPGLRAGIELPIMIVHKHKRKKSGRIKSVIKKRYLVANVGWYHHKNFHDNLSFSLGYAYRRISKNGFFMSYSPEIGYSRTFLGGATYQVDDQGNVSLKKMAGYNYAMAMLSGGLGVDLVVKHNIPIAIYSKLNLMAMFAYNSTTYLRPNLELGVIFTPSNFLKKNTKHLVKNR